MGPSVSKILERGGQPVRKLQVFGSRLASLGD